MLALLGIGMLGQKLYFQLKQQGIKVDFLLDNHKYSTIFDDIQITLPSHPDGTTKEKTTVIVSTFKQELQKDEFNQLVEFILSLGYKEVINIQQAVNRFNLDFEYFYVGKFNQQQKEIKEVLDLLSDEKSQEVFKAHIDFREQGNIDSLHANLNPNDQYAPDFFVNYLNSLETPLTIVDCGACYGDLLTTAIKKSIHVGQYIAFEPDIKNREVLASKLCQTKINSIIIPLGVGNKELNLMFSSGEGMGSHFDKNGTELIKVSPIDSIIFANVHLIKMDIEGFEQEALWGAMRIIETFKPALAISLYHKPNDIITLPLYLAKYYSKFYIRQHGRYGFDLVLYCFN